MAFKNIFLYLCLAVLFFGCDPFGKRLGQLISLRWVIINKTGDSIVIKAMEQLPFTGSFDSMLAVGQSLLYKEATIYQNTWNNQVFCGLYRSDSTRNDSIIIFNKDNTKILKIWKVPDLGIAGRQFFNEKYWQQRNYQYMGSPYHEWTFELLPEDIEPPENTAGL